MSTRVRHNDEGSVTLLILGLSVLVIGVVSVVICASSIYMQARHVDALADQVADALAYSLSDRDYYQEGTQSAHLLREESVEYHKRRILAHIPDSVFSRVQDTRITQVDIIDGRSVGVQMQAQAQLPLIPAFLRPYAPGISVHTYAVAHLMGSR